MLFVSQITNVAFPGNIISPLTVAISSLKPQLSMTFHMGPQWHSTQELVSFSLLPHQIWLPDHCLQHWHRVCLGAAVTARGITRLREDDGSSSPLAVFFEFAHFMFPSQPNPYHTLGLNFFGLRYNSQLAALSHNAAGLFLQVLVLAVSVQCLLEARAFALSLRASPLELLLGIAKVKSSPCLCLAGIATTATPHLITVTKTHLLCD